MLKPGQPAPPFSLPGSDGKTYALAGLKGRWVVLYFYPKDSTPGCTREAEGFRDAAAELARRDAVVLGVSKDSIASHCRFAEKHSLDFPLLSDAEGEVIEAYGAWGEKTMAGRRYMGILRSTVVIGPDGKVAAVFPRVKVDGHVAQVLAALDGARRAA